MSSFYSVLTNQSNDIQNDTLLSDIQNHLTALLNSRQYMVSTSQEYGLPDICSEFSQGYAEKLIHAVRDLINKFEPRLKIQTIECNPDHRKDTQIELKLNACIDQKEYVQLVAMLGAQRTQSVKLI